MYELNLALFAYYDGVFLCLFCCFLFSAAGILLLLLLGLWSDSKFEVSSMLWLTLSSLEVMALSHVVLAIYS
jgi:hypothetical protein